MRPVGSGGDVADLSLLPVGQLDDNSFGLWRRIVAAWIRWIVPRIWRARSRARPWRVRRERVAVPLLIIEVLVRLHEVVDREEVLPIEGPRATPDDLLELDHRFDGPHQNDVSDVPGIHPRGQLVRRRQDRRQRLLVVLELAQVLFAQLAVVGGHALAVMRIGVVLHLVDVVPDPRRVLMRGAEPSTPLLGPLRLRPQHWPTNRIRSRSR